MECPKVDESVKMRIRELPTPDYALIRSTILQEHGPIDPVGYFGREMFRVKGTFREEVRESLMRLLTVYNRAAEDHGREVLTAKNVMYPFLEAFPPAISRQLEQQLALVSVQPEPFEHLFRLAPARPIDTSPAPLHLVQSPTPRLDSTSARTAKKRALSPEASLTSAITALVTRVDQLTKQPRPSFAPRANFVPVKGGCPGCGGRCANRSAECPAYNRTCFQCGTQGHFATVCRKPAESQPPPHQPQSSQPHRFNPNRSFRGGPNRNGRR